MDQGSSSASPVRRKRGDSYHTQHKTTYPFSDWEIKRLAKAEGLKLVKAESKFELSHYPGYTNKRGSGLVGGRRSDDYFPVGECLSKQENIDPTPTSSSLDFNLFIKLL